MHAREKAMSGAIRILRPVGTCSVGDFLAVEFDGRLVEGQITFLARTPTGGWMVTLEAEGAAFEVFCTNGHCTLVHQIASDSGWTFEQLETARKVADTRTGARFTATGL
jgi:hypothetical protein